MLRQRSASGLARRCSLPPLIWLLLPRLLLPQMLPAVVERTQWGRLSCRRCLMLPMSYCV
jgi:hypothetical protein